MTTKKLNIDILARDKSKRALTQVQTRLGNVKNAVFSLKGALVGLGAGAVIKGFVDVGKEVESLNIRFKFLFGSAEEGAKAFDNLAKFAGTVPFSLEEISRASGNLAVVAKDADDLNRILEITGNVASVTGLDFETTASQIQRAFSGGIASADIFRERGVRALLGFEQGAKVSVEETVKRFEELFSGDGRFAKATDDLAQTLEGTISMLGDKFFNFQKDVAEGFFDELKKEFGDLNEFLEQNEQEIENIANTIGGVFATAISKTSSTISTLTPAVKGISGAIGDVINGYNSLPSEVKTAGLIGVILFGRQGIAVATAVGLIIDRLQTLAGLNTELSLVSSEDLRNLDFVDARLSKVREEIQQLQNPDPLVIETLSNADLSKFIEDQEKLNELLKEEAILSRLSNTLSFERSDFYTNLNADILQNAENQKNANNEQIKQQKILSISANMLESGANAQAKLSFRTEEGISKFRELRLELEKFNNQFRTSIDQTEQLRQNFPRFTQTLKDAGDTTLQLDNLFSNTFNNFADTLADSIMTGKFAFKDFARSVIADIARMIAKQQALIAIQKVAGLFGGSIFGFNIGGLLPAMSSGGRVNKGMPVSVGEAGREIFIPQSSGTIVPNNQTGGSTNINFTINTVDATGVDELLTNRRSTIINVINDALNRQGKEALV
mgnify:CR=1 FL=1